MIGAVVRALCGKELYKFDWMPVLSGGQGLGKSLFCRTLFGNMLKEGLPANLSDKDAKQELQRHWCVEVSELTSFKKTTSLRERC